MGAQKNPQVICLFGFIMLINGLELYGLLVDYYDVLSAVCTLLTTHLLVS